MQYYLFLKHSSATAQHATNLEKGRQAVDQCESIRQAVQDQQRKVDTLPTLAELALKKGDRDLALQLLREKGRCHLELTRIRPLLQKAVENLQGITGFLEYEAILLGTLGIWHSTVAGEGYYTPRVVGFTLRRRKSNKTKSALRKRKSKRKQASPKEFAQQLIKRHMKNLEMGLQAAAQCDNLMHMLHNQQKKVDTLEAKAQVALRRGDRDLALQLLREKQSYEQALATTRENFQQALLTLDAIMAALEVPYLGLSPSRKKNSVTVQFYC